IKLRTLTRETKSATSVLWPLPQLPTKEMRFVDLERYHENPEVIRMSAFNCNDPAIVGYSVHHSHRFLSVHAHIPGENTTFYQSNPSFHAVWQYMPVDRDEAVVEIWKHCENSLLQNTSLVVYLHLLAMRNVNTYMAKRPGKQTSRIFYNTSSAGIYLLGFETPSPTPNSQRPTLPTPPSFSPTLYQEFYYYTSAALDGVTTVTPSLHQVAGTSVSISLLLHDSNARATSFVGQIRLDSLGCPLEVGASQRVWLRFLSMRMGGHCVARVATSLPSDIDAHTLTWLALPYYGIPEWWFLHRQCRVHHEGQASPATSKVPAGQYQRLLEEQEPGHGAQ
ncbi:hypothetical protein C7999DRAFT_18369, partial [Corynascus novoguineensis]